jgi:uroporphyrinogen-III synthase
MALPELSLPVGSTAEVLRGFRIGVTADRRADDLIAALERRGAQVLHAPALTVVPNAQDGALVIDTREVILARPDVMLVTTGYGMRRWFEVADAAGLGAELTAVLEQSRIFARGPKSHGAVRAAGLLDAEVSEMETTASLVDAMIAAGLTGRRVAIQLHGFTDDVQLARVREVSTSVMTVTPYRWARPPARGRLARLIRAACSRQLDAVTFTSAPAAKALLDAADDLGLRAELLRAMSEHVAAVAVGPVTAGPLTTAGVPVVVPERYRLGALIRRVTEELVERHVRRFRSGGTAIELRGRCVLVDGRQVMLGPNALLLFTTLAGSASVVSRQELVDRLPDGLDDHALEVAMSRLRRALGVPGLISTVVKRGYRLNAARVA